MDSKSEIRWIKALILGLLCGATLGILFALFTPARGQEALGYYVRINVVCRTEASAWVWMNIHRERQATYEETVEVGCSVSRRAVQWRVRRVVPGEPITDYDGDAMIVLELDGGLYTVGVPEFNTNVPLPGMLPGIGI